MRRFLLPSLFCFLYLIGFAEEPVKVEDKIFNFGAKVGLNSALPVINSLSINDVNVENISYEYKVGILAAVFCRINVDRFFIQPSISWTRSSGSVRFQIPQEESSEFNINYDELKFKIRTIEAPVLIGYKIVKDGPYGLSFMVGPNIKYSYQSDYTSYFSNTPREYESNSSPWGINIVCGVGVSIWRLFFDVTYEFGLNRKDSDFIDYSSAEKTDANIAVDTHTNMMSFSLGLLF